MPFSLQQLLFVRILTLYRRHGVADKVPERARSREKLSYLTGAEMRRYPFCLSQIRKISPTVFNDVRGAFDVCSEVAELPSDNFKGQKDHLFYYDL